jgi:hypothetical protein
MAEEAEVVAAKKKSNNGRKTRKETDFLLTLNSNFFLINAWNPPLFIRGGREIFFFLLGTNLNI